MGAGGVCPSLGALSPPPSRTRGPRGEEALGGCSLKEAGRPSVVECEVAAIIGLRLLKTGPSAESSSDAISNTPLPFSRGAETVDAWTAVRGTATMGAEGMEEGRVGEGARRQRREWEERRHPRPQAPLSAEQGC